MAHHRDVCNTSSSKRYSKYKISPENPQVLLDKELVEETKKGNAEAVKSLLQKGAMVDATSYTKALFYASENYMSPLMHAANLGYEDVVKVLLEKGANPNLRDRFDVTAAHWASEKGHAKCLKLLLDSGANPNVSIKYSIQGEAPVNGGTTPLHLAARNNRSACIKELILNGGDYNCQDELGRTSLYIASQYGHEDSVLVQLRNAIGRDILSLPVKYSESTPLHECVLLNMREAILELLRHGSDVNHRNYSGYTPLHYAVCQSTDDDMELVEMMIAEGYNVNIDKTSSSAIIKDCLVPDSLRNLSEGLSPLQFVSFDAVDEPHTRLFLHRHGLLMNHNARPDGEQPLQNLQNSRLPRRRPKVAALLISYGAKFDINLRPDAKRTLLQNEVFTVREDFTILNAIVRASKNIAPPEMLPIYTLLRIQGRMAEYNAMKKRYDWLKSLSTNPRSLQHLCRCKIRECLGRQRLKYVKNLPLPVLLKDYLMLKN
ncbi:ankyrin repeat and SOCS box protein 7-like [Ptychodera flava]|uniref:ankyrin repeat and SOCS box protein 7-like n=1 Tax=Ptychodera flava TaxID=63121 RepID=UPI00396A7A9F